MAIRSISRSKKQTPLRGVARRLPNARPQEHGRGEIVVQSLGLALAIGSATFASYMISNNEREPEFAGLEHLAIFSKPAGSITPRALTESRPIDARQSETDYTPTGSLAGSKRDLPLRDFILLRAGSDSAVILGPNGVARVSQGDVLRGLGRVTSIERRGEKWVVVTPSGLIVSK